MTAAIILGALQEAQALFHQNIDTHIAAFLVTHPNVDPVNVELVMTSAGGVLTFSIQPRELYVPPVNNYMGDIGADSSSPEEIQREAFAEGWNACRDAMIAMAAAARPADAMVSRLEDQL